MAGWAGWIRDWLGGRNSAVLLALGWMALVPVGTNSHSAAVLPRPALSTLTVGGGPEPRINQVAIESNVRYFDTLLPRGTKRRILFADGNPKNETVLYRVPSPTYSPEEGGFRFLFQEDQESEVEKFRTPNLRSIDAPSQKDSVAASFDTLATEDRDSRLLLYFTGHGSRNKKDINNNTYELWNNQHLSVTDAAVELAKIPKTRPVVLVMVQCFSGAFGNLLFEGGNPTGELINRPFCGFFAATNDRVAAGCTTEVNEADYHDFTSYFFAALTGRDRLGRKVPPPDYNHDGKVGMDEAFAYTLIHDASIDVPVSTTDVFLRRFVAMTDDQVVENSYTKVLSWASPAQRAALEGLSKNIGATGETRLKLALIRMRDSGKESSSPHHDTMSQNDEDSTAVLITKWRNTLTDRFPGLNTRHFRDGHYLGTPDYDSARPKAIAFLAKEPTALHQIAAAQQQIRRAADATYQDEILDARWLRLLRVGKSVVLEHTLRETHDTKRIAQFDALRELERGNPLR